MISLRQAREEDIILLAENAVDESLLGKDAYVRKWAKLNAELGPAYAAEFEGELVAAAGIRIVRAGIGNAWIVVKNNVESKSYTFTERVEAMVAVRKLIKMMMADFGLIKVRAYSRIGFAKSQRLLEYLGFERLSRYKNGFYFYVLRV